MAELADARDSKSRSFGSVGSTPTFGTSDYSIATPAHPPIAGVFSLLPGASLCGTMPAVTSENLMRSPTRFFSGILIGMLLGLLFGWVIQPVEYVDTTPDALRADYRADYVLMVAEAYASDSDLEYARIRLAALGPRPPVSMAVEAIDFGLQHGYTQLELDTLNRLVVDLRAIPPAAEIESP